MSIMKKVLFVVAFVFGALVVPALILLAFVDSTSYFAVYVITYAVILFAIFGYIVVSIKSMSKELHDAVEDMKKQNAAIAYRLTSGVVEYEPENTVVGNVTDAEPEVKEQITPKKVNLNPADDFVSESVGNNPIADDIDDFK